jgi:predicted TIM-barrel enzyme
MVKQTIIKNKKLPVLAGLKGFDPYGSIRAYPEIERSR